MTVTLRLPSRGAITSGFGKRTGGFHEGIDFGWGNGYNIYAAASGTVRHAGPGGAYGARYGNLTALDHPGFQTRYGHQSRMYVRAGQWVKAGDLIGVKGGSGANGPHSYPDHLHFELLINGRKVDPLPYFTAPAGGGSTPLPIEEDEKEDDMKPDIIGHKNEEVAVLAPWLPNGYLTAKVGTEVAIGWARRFSPTKDSLVPMYDRATYLGMIAGAKALGDGYQAALPKSGVAVSPPVVSGGASKADLDAAAARIIEQIPTVFRSGQA